MAGFGNLLAERTVETGKRSVTVAQNPQIAEPVFRLADVNVYYGDFRAVRDVTLDVTAHQITALIGPSGCGKSTLIRSLNRMNDLIPGARVEGKVLYHEQDLYDPAVDPVAVRRRIGMVFQRPNPFPKSIYENIAFGLKVNGLTDDIDDRIEHALKAAALWDEVKANLKKSAYDLFLTRELKRARLVRIPGVNASVDLFFAEKLDALEAAGQVVFRYCTPEGLITPEANPNGAARNIAGICNREGNVLGMMPHPERCSEPVLGNVDGLALFAGAVETGSRQLLRAAGAAR